MEIYKDIAVPIVHKIWHIHDLGKRVHRDFTKDFGDVPVGRWNPETGKFEECVNLRGRAYAARRLKYRAKKYTPAKKG